MSDPTGTLYDGDHETPFLHGPVKPVVSNDTLSMLYIVTLRIRAPFYRRTPRGTVLGGVPGFLVEEGAPRVVGGDLLQWEAVFAEVPPQRVVPEPYVYPWQFITSTSSGTGTNATVDVELAELPVPVTSFVTYDYFHTATPQNIALPKAFRMAMLSKWVVALGTQPSQGAQQLQAEDAGLTRWRGDIWERTIRMVEVRSLQALGSRP